MDQAAFDQALERFVEGVRNLLADELRRRSPSLQPPRVTTMVGQKYVRIVKEEGSSRSVYGFVDLTTGDVLKADGWRRPAKGARGNIFDQNLLGRCGPYSVG